jgi:hypothetical protein
MRTALVLACLAMPVAATEQPATAPDSSRSEAIDEVLVRGTRLRELRAEIVAAEDRFYARYNELNKVDDFDIACAEDAHTGTRIPRRRCFTKVQQDAKAQHGLEVLQMFQQQSGSGPADPSQSDARSAGMTAVGRPPNTDPVAVWEARFDEYRDNMLYLMKMHPELRRMAREAEKAQRRYDDEHRRRLRGRLLLIE